MLKQILAVFLAVTSIFIMSCDEDSGTGPTATLEAPVITVTPDTSALIVSWAAVSGAAFYNVYWGTSPGVTASSPNPFDNIKATKCNHMGLANDITIYYRVSANGDNVNASPLSDEESGMPISVIIDPPETFKATGWDGKVILSWLKSTGASSYTLYWDTTSGVSTSSNIIDSITSLAYDHSGLTNGIKYYYKIAAKDAGGIASALSTEINATPESGVENPQNLTATPGNGFVLLKIDEYTSGKASFRIYWDTTAGITTSSDTIVDPSGKGISFPFTQTDVTNGTTYYYRAMAIVSGTESGLSNEASATPSDSIPIGVPQGVKATKGNAQVTLSWNTVVGAAAYNIFWATDSVVSIQSDSISGISKGPYIHTGLTNFTTYYYKINAEDANGNTSDLSIEVNATPDTSGSDLAPKNVVATPGTGQVVITWDPVNGGLGYAVYGDTKPGITEKSPLVGDKLPEGSSSYTHTPVPAGTTYYYKVGVWIKVGSDYDLHLSKEVSATPTK